MMNGKKMKENLTRLLSDDILKYDTPEIIDMKTQIIMGRDFDIPSWAFKYVNAEVITELIGRMEEYMFSEKFYGPVGTPKVTVRKNEIITEIYSNFYNFIESYKIYHQFTPSEVKSFIVMMKGVSSGHMNNHSVIRHNYSYDGSFSLLALIPIFHYDGITKVLNGVVNPRDILESYIYSASLLHPGELNVIPKEIIRYCMGKEYAAIMSVGKGEKFNPMPPSGLDVDIFPTFPVETEEERISLYISLYEAGYKKFIVPYKEFISVTPEYIQMGNMNRLKWIPKDITRQDLERYFNKYIDCGEMWLSTPLLPKRVRRIVDSDEMEDSFMDIKGVKMHPKDAVFLTIQYNINNLPVISEHIAYSMTGRSTIVDKVLTNPNNIPYDFNIITTKFYMDDGMTTYAPWFTKGMIERFLNANKTEEETLTMAKYMWVIMKNFGFSWFIHSISKEDLRTLFIADTDFVETDYGTKQTLNEFIINELNNMSSISIPVKEKILWVLTDPDVPSDLDDIIPLNRGNDWTHLFKINPRFFETVALGDDSMGALVELNMLAKKMIKDNPQLISIIPVSCLGLVDLETVIRVNPRYIHITPVFGHGIEDIIPRVSFVSDCVEDPNLLSYVFDIDDPVTRNMVIASML